MPELAAGTEGREAGAHPTGEALDSRKVERVTELVYQLLREDLLRSQQRRGEGLRLR
jgi:hypothetical protein